MSWIRSIGWLALLVSVTSDELGAQDPQQTGDLLNLFFDCQAAGCRDFDYFRRDVPFVNWVRDRRDSDLHVLVTGQQTGGGGRSYVINFIGQRDLAGQDQTLTMATRGDATGDEEREGIARRLKLGLVAYVQGTAIADELEVRLRTVEGPEAAQGGGREAPGGQAPTASADDDPWDFWVFRINGNGFLTGQATSRSNSFFGAISADRTTEELKLSVSGNYNRNVQEFDIPQSDGSLNQIRETREDWGVTSSVVKSLGGQWAVGVRANAGSSTFLNQDFRWSIRPGIEYNVFPYAESSRRSMTLQYLVGLQAFDYTEETIFGELAETRPQHSATASLLLIEPWGRWQTSLNGQQFLHDPEKYSVTLSGSVNVRLFRGFSVRMSGNYSWIRDQIYLSTRGATDEQVLLQQRQLATNSRYFTSFGIEYRFGSIFNNIVNPRFGGDGDVFFF